MARKHRSKTNRIGWIAMHGGFLVWGICLFVLAEEYRDGADAPAIAEKPPPSGQQAQEAQAAKTLAWVEGQIQALGDPVYGVRAKATRQLLAAGPKAVERLSLALQNRDPEVARRSRYILERLARGDQAGFLALEQVARDSDHPSAKLVEAIVRDELDRRERVTAALTEQRQVVAHRLLREGRAALYQGRFAEAREKALAAQALDVPYNLFDDRPDLVLNAIRQAQARPQPSKAAPLITAERE